MYGSISSVSIDSWSRTFGGSRDTASGQGSHLALPDPLGEVLLEQWSLSSLADSGDMGPLGVLLLLDEVLQRDGICDDITIMTY